MIKTEFWDDEKLATISRDARLTYIALWNFSDDYGVVKGHHARLENILKNTVKLDAKHAKFQKEYYEMRKALSEQYAELLKKNPVKKI